MGEGYSISVAAAQQIHPEVHLGLQDLSLPRRELVCVVSEDEVSQYAVVHGCRGCHP